MNKQKYNIGEIMKKVILFGIGENGKKVIDAYLKYDKCFEIVAIADNSSDLKEYKGIPVIKPDRISDFSYDEIWITTIYYQEITKQLTGELHIAQSDIRYIEFPMPFLEQQIYKRYVNEIRKGKKCKSDELQEVINYMKDNGVRMYCYPFFDEYAEKDYPVYFDVECKLYYGMYAGHKIYLAKTYNTPQKAKQYLRYIYMEQDKRSPHCYFAGDFQIEKDEVGIDVGAAEGVFALDIIDKVGHIYLIEAEPDWCEALALTFQEYRQKVTIIQGFVSDSEDEGQLVLDRQFKDMKIDFVKMDIEGAEKEALQGAISLIGKNMPKLAVCTYHRMADYQDISRWLFGKGYLVKNSRGYVICQGEWELDHLADVDFRRALIWAERA